MQFLEHTCGWPESVHDSSILKNSNIFLKLLLSNLEGMSTFLEMEDTHYSRKIFTLSEADLEILEREGQNPISAKWGSGNSNWMSILVFFS